jgi:cholesterol transport system auxiliary component
MGLLSAITVLAACGGLSSKAEPEQLYVLHATRATPAAAALPGTLVIPRPAVQPGLDTFRIAVTRAGNELDYFALSRWSGSLPEVLGAFAVQSLSGTFTTVSGPDRSVGAADFELLLTARNFEARYAEGSGAPVVRVAFDCVLTGMRPRRVIGSCEVEVEEPATDNRMSAIVAAFERGAQRALGEIRAKVQTLSAVGPQAGAGGAPPR